MLLRIRGWISKLPCRKATAASQALSHLPFCKKKRLNVNGCLLSRWLPYKLLYSRLRSTLMDQMGQKWCREFFWPSEMDCNRSSDVSIPPDNSRKIGDIQWPASPPGDPHRDFVTASAEYLDKPGFSTALATVSKATRRSKAMVFVHGFNNRFDDAAYRLAQIVQDSKAPVIPVLFSWPSRGVVSLSAYNYDRESASQSRQSLEEVLDTIARSPTIKEVTLVCHSMGCQLTMEALRLRSMHAGKTGAKVRNVLLVAPDVDFNVFHEQMQQIGSNRPRFALFLSQDDHALKISKSILGGATRLGDINPEEEPYKSNLAHEKIMVFDVTHLEGDPHTRAFDDVDSVMGMIERRLATGQQLEEDPKRVAVVAQ